MTLEEYNKTMDIYAERIKNGEDIMDEVNNFQYKFMKNEIENFNPCCIEEEICKELLKEATYYSESGSVVYCVPLEKFKNEASDILLEDRLQDIVWEKIGNYLLDEQVYSEEDEVVVDCIFAGYYVPCWDGWLE